MNYKMAIAKAIAIFIVVLAVYVILEGEKIQYGLVRAMYDVMGIVMLIGSAVVLIARQD